MTIPDLLFLLMLFVVQPAYGAWSIRTYIAQAKAGQTNLSREYTLTMVIQWSALAAVLATWMILGRDVALLGFVPLSLQGLLTGVVTVLLSLAIFGYGWWQVRHLNAEGKQKVIVDQGDLMYFLPSTDRELRFGAALSVTAGIVEEIIYRGFVIWCLATLMPIWAAALVSSIAFGAGHLYQGVAGALKTGVAGLVFAVIYLVSGSIWVPILVHIIVDVVQMFTVRELYVRRDASPLPGT